MIVIKKKAFADIISYFHTAVNMRLPTKAVVSPVPKHRRAKPDLPTSRVVLW